MLIKHLVVDHATVADHNKISFEEFKALAIATERRYCICRRGEKESYLTFGGLPLGSTHKDIQRHRDCSGNGTAGQISIHV